ncbi:MAG: hypothetical protein JNM70_05510 [Anaerolineae bacterium]|nr:hypothetical protein [Anaerolineae bacterium]
MPVNLIWADEDATILTIDIDGAWEWEDFYHVVDYVQARAELVSGRLDMVVWRRSGAVMPHGTMAAHIIQAMRMMPDRFGVVAVVTTNTLVRGFAQLIENTVGGNRFRRIIVAPTHAEALSAIQRCREEAQTLYSG